MKRIFIPGLFLFISMNVFCQNLVNFKQVYFNFPSSQESSDILVENDLFLQDLSQFDLSARMKTSELVTFGEFRDHISASTEDWSDAEISRIESIISDFSVKLEDYNLLFPESINFIKTNGEEEGNAAYCRGLNSIVIPEDKMSFSDQELEQLILHELFHIYTRNNPDEQEALFSIIGFYRTGNLELPENIARWKITNPDAISLNYYFESDINGKELKLMPLLLAESEYKETEGGEFFEYLILAFIAIETNDSGTFPKVADGNYILLPLSKIPNYYDLIGRNTGYIIHPEEILAENFVLMVYNAQNVESEWILAEMRDLLE